MVHGVKDIMLATIRSHRMATLSMDRSSDPPFLLLDLVPWPDLDAEMAIGLLDIMRKQQQSQEQPQQHLQQDLRDRAMGQLMASHGLGSVLQTSSPTVATGAGAEARAGAGAEATHAGAPHLPEAAQVVKMKGVRQSHGGRWRGHIWLKGKDMHLGTYDTQCEAAMAYDMASLMLRRKKQDINSPLSDYLDAQGRVIEDPDIRVWLDAALKKR